MKLLVVTNDFPPRVGGIQTYVHEIVSRLNDEVIVVASTHEGAREFDSGFRHRVIRLPTAMMLPTPAVTRRVTEIVRATRPDVVLFGAAAPLGVMGPRWLREFGVPYVAFTHGAELIAARIPGVRAMLARVGRQAVAVTAVSHWMAAALEPVMSPGRAMPILPSGVDTARFHPGVSDAAVRVRHGLGDATVVCCVSRLVPRKGQDDIIRALAHLAPAHASLRALVVGHGPDAQRLHALAARVGVTDRVVFAGEVPDADLPAYFRCGDIFAMPCRSRWMGLEVEGLGAVLLQAAAVGRPVIAGSSGGAPEAVVDGQTGFVVGGRGASRVGSLTGALDTLLRDPPRAASMGALGADRIRRSYSWDQIAARFKAILAGVVTAA